MATLSSLLVHDDVVSVEVIEDALQRQVLEGGDIDTALLELGALPENVLNGYRAASYGLGPATRDQVMGPRADHLKLVSPDVARQHRVVPVGLEGDKLVLAVAEPPEKPARDALRQALGRDIELRVAVEVRIEAALALHYGLDIPGRMRRLAEQLRTRDSGALPSIRVASAGVAGAADFTADILRAFDSEPPPPPGRPYEPARPAAPASPVPAVVVARPVVSVAPMVRLGEPSRAAPVSRAPVAEAPPPPGVPVAAAPAPAPPPAPPRPASAPPTAPAFAAVSPSSPPAPPASPTSPAFSAAPAPAPAARRANSFLPKAAPVRIARKPISRPLGARRGSILPLGPLSAEAAHARIEAAADRDAVVELFFGFARQFFECSALFALRDEQAIGLEARGLADLVDISSVALPVVKGSALDETERSRLPRVLDLSRHEDDQPLVTALKRQAGQPAALVPVLIRNRAVFVLYGDRDGAFFRVEDMADLVELLPAVSRAFERIIRTRKVFARDAHSGARPEVVAPQPTPSLEPRPPLGTWGNSPRGVDVPATSHVPAPAAAPAAPAAPAAVVAAAQPDGELATDPAAPLEPAERGDQPPPWPPRSSGAQPQEDPAAAPKRIDHVSLPFMRAVVPTKLPPERALAPLGLSRDAPPPPRFADKSVLQSPPVTDLERNPTVKLPRRSAPPPARTDKRQSNKPPPGAGSYSADPPPAEMLKPMRVPVVEPEPAPRRKTERPHRRRDEPVDLLDGGDPRDTVRQRPAPVRRRNEGGSSYSVQDVPSERISVLPPAPDADEDEDDAPTAAESPPVEAPPTAPPPARAAAASRTPGPVASRRPPPPPTPSPAAAAPAEAVPATGRSVIVDLDADLNGLIEELMRCGPDDEAPVMARIARVGEPALPILAQRFPGPLWFDRRQSHQRLPRGRDVSAIARALAAFGERANKYLVPLLESRSLETRFYATLLAVDSLHPGLLSALAERLLDPDAKIRLLVLDALGAYQHLPAFDAVLETLRRRALDTGSSLQTRMTAIDALAQLRDVDSVELLIELAAHTDRQLSVPAHRALVAITAQDFGNAERKWRAWLKKHGEQYRAEWLIEGLMHGDEKVRAIAGRELQELSQVYFGYVAGAPKRERERAQRRYMDWWRNEGLPTLESERG